MSAITDLRCSIACLLAFMALFVFLSSTGTAEQGIGKGRQLSQFPRIVHGDDQGLCNQTVNCIAQTRDRYIWFGTQEGLARFDGNRFVSFNQQTDSAFQVGRIWTLLPASDGRLWIGTHDGLVCFSDGKFVRYSTEDGLVGNSVISLFESADGAIWAGTLGQGVSRYFNNEFTSHAITLDPQSATGGVVWGICEDARGAMWFGTVDGVYSKLGDSMIRLGKLDGLPSEMVIHMSMGRDGKIFVGSIEGLAILVDGKISRVVGAKDGLGNGRVRTVSEDAQGDIWIGTMGSGVFRLRGDSIEALSKADGLSSDVVLSSFHDADGDHWIGTQFGGVVQLRQSYMTPFTEQQGIDQDSITSIASQKETLWAGTQSGKIFKQTGDRFVDATPVGSRTGRIECQYADEDGTLWFAQSGILYHSTETTLDSYPLPGKSDRPNIATEIARDSRGVLWIGATNGLNKFDGNKFETFVARKGPGEPHVKSLCVDNQNNVWIATVRGVFRFCDGEFAPFTSTQGLVDDDTSCVYCDRQDSIWVGSRRGLSRIQDGKITNCRAKDGLAEESVYSIAEDDLNQLWLTSHRGLTRIAKNDFDTFSTGECLSVSSDLIEADQGLPGKECLCVHFCKTSTAGTIWVGTNKGMAAVNPRQPIASIKPSTIIEEISIDGKSASNSLVMEPGNHRVEIRYAAPVFSKLSSMRFQHKLIGFDEAWIDAGSQRVATYTGLGHGTYSFMVRAANGKGDWGEQSSELQFVQRPHFSQTRWFSAAMIGAGCLIVFGAFRLRSRQIRRENDAILAERLRIARELHDTLLQSVQGVVYRLQSVADGLPAEAENSKRDLNNTMNMMDRAIAEARQSVTDLRRISTDVDWTHSIKEAIADLQNETRVKICLEVIGKPIAVSDETHLVFLRVCREAVGNSIQHANAQCIDVELLFDGILAKLSIVDDGCGFETTVGQQKSMHFGIKGMQERAQEIGGKLTIRSQPAKGTTVGLIVPIDAKVSWRNSAGQTRASTS
jgi:ligand-binding sensor domain-containing protein/signal transduction histidine kinase